MKGLFISGQRHALAIFEFASLALVSWPTKPRPQNLDVTSSSPATSAAEKQRREVNSAEAYLVLKLSACLREPLKTTVSILKKNKAFLRKTERIRNSYCSTKQLTQHINSFRIDNLEQFLQLYSNDPRSRILASFHFGDFPYGLNKLVALQPNFVHSKVLSQTKHSSIYQENMRRGFGNNAPSAESQFIQNETNAHKLAGFLRQQSAVLLMFADLPSTYGESTRVKFLGRWAWFPKGIAVLSLATKVPVLPTICYSIGKNNFIEIGKQIEPVCKQGESKDAAVARITQLLAEFFEHFFRQHQEQWRYLNILPRYFCDPREETAIE